MAAIPAGVITHGELDILTLLTRGETVTAAGALLDLNFTATTGRLARARHRTGTRTTAHLLIHAITTNQLAIKPAPLDTAARYRIETALRDLAPGPGALLDLSDSDDLATVLHAVLNALTPPAVHAVPAP